jgi:hypothetical protein
MVFFRNAKMLETRGQLVLLAKGFEFPLPSCWSFILLNKKQWDEDNFALKK